MKMRRLLSVLLAVCMIMTAIPAYATEVQDAVDEEVKVTATETATEEENLPDAVYEEDKEDEEDIASPSDAKYADDEEDDDEKDVASSSNAEYSGKDDIVLTATAEDGVKVTLTADADAFEHYGELKLKVSVVELNDSEEDALDEKENENVAKRVTYDISVLDGDTIVEPSKDVDVKFELPDVPSGADGINIYHHDTDGIEVVATEELDGASDSTATVVGETEKATDIDLTDLSDEELAELDDEEIINDVTVKATVDSFSKYTVDFTYNEITASIPGGTNHNKLADVLAKVDITKAIEDAKAYQDADCTKIASNGIVKDENGKELFKVYKENDVWYVDAINSFTSEHGLKVKTSDNAEYNIKVTDPQSVYYTAKFDLNGGDIADEKKVTLTGMQWICDAGIWSKQFNAGTSYSAIIGEWSGITPTKSGCVFAKWTPESGTLTAATTFTATYTCTVVCEVKDVLSAPISGATVSFTIAGESKPATSTTTDDQGNYSLENVPKDANGTFTVSKSGYKTFTDSKSFSTNYDYGTIILDVQQTPVSYIDADGGTETCNDYTVVSSSTSLINWGTAGKNKWYVVEGTVTLTNGAVCLGDVHLILKDGCSLTVEGSSNYAGICVTGSNSLTIYGQSAGTGKLYATGGNDSSGFPMGGAGIGGGFNGAGSNITINGGTVTATGALGGAGIGGGAEGAGSNITINGGKVDATGNKGGAGIGGGNNGNGSNITINGGTVTAKVVTDGTDTCDGAGIGGGSSGAGSNITINGGKVKATGGRCGAGIGGGSGGNDITINGGEVTATGGMFAAGIGGGDGNYGNGSNITINGGEVTATGGAGTNKCAAGIGGGALGAGSNITINGGTVTATGGKDGTSIAAGIGNGNNCTTAASNIKAAASVVVKAGASENPTDSIAHKSDTDIATSLAGKRYVTAIKSTPTPTPTPDPTPTPASKSSGSSGGSGSWSSTPTTYGSSSSPITTGAWKKNADGTFTLSMNGEKLLNSKAWVKYKGTDGKEYTGCFYFDRNGLMQVGWQKIDGKWYYFDPKEGNTKGMMQTNTTTPDGYKVDANGQWMQ